MSLSTRLTTVLVLLLLALPALPQSRPRSGPGTGDPYESLVPWRFLEKGSAFVNAPLVLYWLPASPQETEASPLLTSRELVQATDRCISFAVVLPADAAMIEKLGQTGKLPAVVLADAKGEVLGRVEGSRGRVTAPPVEKIVRDELNKRGEAMYVRMTEAKKRAANGDKDGAIDLYRKLWDERCLFPLAGREAQEALKGLGVIVVEPPPQIMVDPNLPVPGTAPAKAKPKPPEGH